MHLNINLFRRWQHLSLSLSCRISFVIFVWRSTQKKPPPCLRRNLNKGWIITSPLLGKVVKKKKGEKKEEKENVGVKVWVINWNSRWWCENRVSTCWKRCHSFPFLKKYFCPFPLLEKIPEPELWFPSPSFHPHIRKENHLLTNVRLSPHFKFNASIVLATHFLWFSQKRVPINCRPFCARPRQVMNGIVCFYSAFQESGIKGPFFSSSSSFAKECPTLRFFFFLSKSPRLVICFGGVPHRRRYLEIFKEKWLTLNKPCRYEKKKKENKKWNVTEAPQWSQLPTLLTDTPPPPSSVSSF